MYWETRIQHWRRDPVYFYKSWMFLASVAHEAKNIQLLRTELPRWLLLLLHHWTQRAGALETSAGRAGYFWFSALLTWMGIKWFNLAAILDFPNVIGPNCSNPDSKISHSVGVVMLNKMCPSIYRCLLPSVWQKVFWGPIASRDGLESCNSTVWQRIKLASQPRTLPGALVLPKTEY